MTYTVLCRVKRYFELTLPDGVRTVIKAPDASHSVGKPIRSIGASPGGALISVGGDNGMLQLVDGSDGSIRRELTGHVGDLTTTRFFPSGQVILSGATDLQVKIWGLDGSNPVTLKGHTRGISDTAIIDRGRNVITCGKDGTAKLWLCASGENIATLSPEGGPVLCMALGDDEAGVIQKEPDDPREFGTRGKMVFLGCQNGSVVAYDLGTKSKTLTIPLTPSTPITAIHACTARGLLVVGTQSGLVELYDYATTTDTSTHLPLASFKRNDAAITGVRILPLGVGGGVGGGGKEHGGHEGTGVEVFVVNAEGSCFRARIDTSDSTAGALPVPHVVVEYVGADVDPLVGVVEVRSGGGGGVEVVTGGREGVVRVYR
ncbi:hypothetical protein HDV00_011657 [Rhizophlyctis rosea]|nr:hypothetical protein HDV00_011657 [Rhizophlyctis rosea]